MGLSEQTSSERVHIGIFGRTNAGKSTIMNALTNQNIALVSEVEGTTTDLVKKSMELLPIGPVVLIDTPGIEDNSSLGELRQTKTKEAMRLIDIAILVVGGKDRADEQILTEIEITDDEYSLLADFKKNNVKYVVVYNYCESGKSGGSNPIDKTNPVLTYKSNILEEKLVKVNPMDSGNPGINNLKNTLGELYKNEKSIRLVGDFITQGDKVILVIPIDAAAPKGRLILPQQMAIRDCLDSKAIPVCTQVDTLAETIEALQGDVKLVITDSQAFAEVSRIVPEDISLTSFSILMARYRGVLNQAYDGTKALDSIKAGDTILISEGCTHHRQCGDIGTVKLPAWIRKHTGLSENEIHFEYTSGGGFKEDLTKYKLIIHCGGCMVNDREMASRLNEATRQGVKMTNYGTAIAHMKGILKRSVEIVGLD